MILFKYLIKIDSYFFIIWLKFVFVLDRLIQYSFYIDLIWHSTKSQKVLRIQYLRIVKYIFLYSYGLFLLLLGIGRLLVPCDVAGYKLHDM